VIEKSGTWLSFGGERMGQGRENARLFLKENTDIRAKIEDALRKKLGLAAIGHSENPAQAPAPTSLSQGDKALSAAAAASASKGKPAR
jgi:recombination protein RecA